MTHTRRKLGQWRSAAVAGALAIAVAAVAALGTGKSFTTFLEAGYEQELYGVAQLPPDADGFATILGGVAFAPDGDPWVSECLFQGTRLHRFDSQTFAPTTNGTSTLHPRTSVNTQGGCGLTNHPDGFIYSNSSLGIVRLNASTGLAVPWPGANPNPRGAPGNALGITVDPRTGHLIYAGKDCHPSLVPGAATCTIYDLDPANTTTTPTTIFALLDHDDVPFVDGVYFDPTGTYLFMANRGSVEGIHFLTILRRPEASVPNTTLPQIVQSILTSSEPDGVAFHAAAPKFVVTNDENGGTMTKFTFENDDYTKPPTVATFASGGFRGDLLQVGIDGCIYATQGRNALVDDPATRYDDGTTTTEDSVVRICAPGGGFVPPPGVPETVTGADPCTGTIGDFVWADLDRDGIQDAGEPGIATALTLRAANGNIVATTTSGANGAYAFTAACAGTYTVEVATPPGYTPTTSGVGANANVDSNPSPALVTLAASNAQDLSVDFGFVPGRISGFTYADVNKNGVFDAGEPVINGVTVSLSGAATGTRTTAGGGAYDFNNLAAGTYSVSAPATAGALTRSTPSPLTVMLGPGEDRPNVNFGYTELAAPICVVNNAQGTMTFQDPGSGIVSLKITKNLNNNFRVTMPTLAPGPWPAGTTVTFNPPSTQSLVVSAVRINTSVSAQLIVVGTDLFGNTVTCDPVITEVTKLRHERGIQTFTDLPFAEHIVTVENDEPGLRALDVIVNGIEFRVRNLRNRERQVLNVRSAMRPGNDNTITLIPRGRRGESATVTISDAPAWSQ